MNLLPKPLRFSVSALLLWVLVVSLSFITLLWGESRGPRLLVCVGITSLSLAMMVPVIVILHRCWKFTIPIAVTLLAIYIGIYGVLSANGCYEPGGIGIDHVKWYSWAPVGFVYDYQWNDSLMLVFLPLYIWDVTFWHPDVFPGYSGPYRINALEPLEPNGPVAAGNQESG